MLFFAVMLMLCAEIVGPAQSQGQEPALAKQKKGLDKITVSYQPSLYWAFPFYVATQLKLWKAVGLEPKFVTYPSGAPQVAALKDGAWDVGSTGSIPAVIGASQNSLLVIGISNLESKINTLMVSADRFEAVKGDPQLLKGATIALSKNSTTDYAIRSCFKKWGLDSAAVTYNNLPQTQIVAEFLEGKLDYAGVWAPYSYILAEKAGAKQLCNGLEGGVVIPGVLVARSAFAKENPVTVQKFLAVYLRAWAWIGLNRKQALPMMREFYKRGKVDISDSSLNAEYELRPTFNLNQQLVLFDKTKGPSSIDGWFIEIGTFMQSVGTVPNVPSTKDFIVSEYMTAIKADRTLYAFAQAADLEAARKSTTKIRKPTKAELNKLLDAMEK